MNRRQFFKRIAATAAAAVVAPAALVRAGEKKSLPFKPNPMQRKIILDMDKYRKTHPQYWSLTNRKWWE